MYTPPKSMFEAYYMSRWSWTAEWSNYIWDFQAKNTSKNSTINKMNK